MMPTCFVVMGFGEKADYATGRTLDLDKTYRTIIRRAVEEAGLECIRADDVVHSGLIDTPMYELLLSADVVVADLSTSNANAIYELGVRHALRPHTTIVLAEKEFRFPFDLGHLVIRKYEHLGKVIDAEEAERARNELAGAIRKLVKEPQVDSPVFKFLPRLSQSEATVPRPAAASQAAAVATAAAPAAAEQRPSLLMQTFRDARAREKWGFAKELLNTLLERAPGDPYLLQQLALATYKSKEPDAFVSLLAAKAILEQLEPHKTTDAETLGLWGAVHKRLWELKEDRQALDDGIWALEKGFYVKNDHYNGINLAFLLNTRAAVSTGKDAVTDATLAERIRQRVITICEAQRARPLTTEDGSIDEEEMFWVNASLVEALAGTGQATAAATLRDEIVVKAPESWMPKTLDDQLKKLAFLVGHTAGH
jgi:hypothetical protein